MKKVVAFFFLLFSFVMIYAAEPDSTAFDSRTSDPIERENCTFKGIPLYGKVEVVTIGADFKVEVVTCGADLKVEPVTMSADRCGEWEFVTIGADFKVEFVTIGADFKVEFVTISPGVN